jgi:tetratricopeptide (TPR) repeat protein
MESLATSLSDVGRTIEATRLLRDTVARRTDAHGPLHPLTLRAETWLGQILFVAGAPEEAAALFFHVINVNAESERSESIEHFEVMLWLGASLTMAGSNDVSEIFLTRAKSALGTSLGPEHIATLRATAWLARSVAQQGDLPRALELRRHVLEACRKGFGPDHPATLRSLLNLAYVIHLAGDDSEAVKLLHEYAEAKYRLGSDYDDDARRANHLLDFIEQPAQTVDPPTNSCISET